MSEHKHSCLSCTPEMVPDFRRDDPKYHDKQKCHTTLRAAVDGVDPGYTQGMYEGREGWAIVINGDIDTMHACPCGEHLMCVSPLFGVVTVVHEGACA